MKTCPSCGSEIADDASVCPCGYAFEEATEPEKVGEPEERHEEEEAFEEEGPPMKLCVFCLSQIPDPALRCPHCAGFLGVAEGRISKGYFFYLFCCLSLVIGTLLDWERGHEIFNLTGADSIAGGFILIFAAYGVFASFFSIFHRKMIVWPVLLASVDGAVFGWTRLVSIVNRTHPHVKAASGLLHIRQTIKAYLTAIGPGLYIVVLISTLVILSLIFSIYLGGRRAAERKEAERAARATRRARR